MRCSTRQPDGLPGIANFNDDGDGIVDNLTEFGTEGPMTSVTGC